MKKAFNAPFLFLFILFASFSIAQVKIEEWIELNPQNATLQDTTGSIKKGATLDNVSNQQSTFNMPVKGKVKVEVTFSEAAGGSRISLEIRQPEYQMLCEYANQNIGFTWTSDVYEKNTPVEFGIDWYYNSWGTIYQGKEAGALVKKVNEFEYKMGFEAAGDDWDYNELVIGVKIIGDSLDHFEIAIIPDTLAEKDTLAFTETARLFVQAKDADNKDINLNSDKLLTLKIETNESYGTFIDTNGDTLKTSPVILDGIPYGDANQGLIKLAAVKKNPASIVKCLIKVALQEDTTKNGEHEAVILEQTLKLIFDNPLEVEPIITRRSYDENHRDYIDNTTEDNTKQFRVRLTRGGKFVNNHRFKLSTKYILGSGGHDHLEFLRPDNTERLKWQNYGRFYSYQINSTKNPLTETTLLGNIPNRFDYIASIWGDTMKIYLNSTQNPLLKDSTEIIERIPSLDRLLPNENFVLIGGTANHHGPPGYQDDNNHFGTNIMRIHILDIATEYRARLPQEPLLNINDMSLPFGGKFDIYGRWRGSHADHRTGRNVDIQSRNMEGDRYLDANHNGIYDPDPINNPNEVLLYDANNNGLYDGETLEIFRSICEENGPTWVLLENPRNNNGYSEHWHLEF